MAENTTLPNSALAALLKTADGQNQLLPVSKAQLIELQNAITNSYVSVNATDSVQTALENLASGIVTSTQAAYLYVDSEINKLDSTAYGTKKQQNETYGSQYISYIYEEDGIIKGEASDLTAAAVSYTGGDGRATVQEELEHINVKVSEFAAGAALKLYKNNNGTLAELTQESQKVIKADGSEYVIKQGDGVIAKFNIERDSFVTDGVARIATAADVTAAGGNDAGFSEGDWIIVLTVAPVDEDEKDIYIPAESLVDAYTAKNEQGAKVIVTVDDTTNEISATLSNEVLRQLSYADTSIQTISSGTNNGAIAYTGIDGMSHDVYVTGLKAVSYTGNASDVSITTANNSDLASLIGNTESNKNVQYALEQLATNYATLNSDAIKVINGGSDVSSYITITPTKSGNTYTLGITTTLGNVAKLTYDSKEISDVVTDIFYNAIA